MMAGAEEPATLSGLCQPMAKTAMVQEETPVKPDSMSLPPGQSGFGDARIKRAVGPCAGETFVVAPGLWVIWGGREELRVREASRSAVLAHSRGDAL